MESAADSPLAIERLPLSLSQQEVWVDQRAWPGSTHLNIGGAGYVDGPFDLALFRQALASLVRENEALRLVPQVDGGQILLQTFEPSLRIVDLSGELAPREAMRAWWQAWMAEPFAFDGRPPWRFALLRHDDSLHALCIQFHHLIMDGWGASQVMQRWAAHYNALQQGIPVPPTNDPGYRQFISESLEYRDSVAFEKDAQFWREQLPQMPAQLFERRYPVPSMGRVPPALIAKLALSRSDYERLENVAQAAGTTLFAFMTAAIAVYLARSAGRSEVVIGLPSLNRSGRRYRESLGMFVGVFPLVVRLTNDMTVAELLVSVSLGLKAAVRHQRYPISELARYLGAIRQRRDSIFDVLFSFERQDYDLGFGAGRITGARQIFSGLARYPLGITLCAFQATQDVELTLEASPVCFSAEETNYLIRRLWHLMQDMADHPTCSLASLSLLPVEERQALLPVVAATATAPPQTFVASFEQWVERTPRATAVVWDGGCLDYRTLNDWANHLAKRLRELGAGRDCVVAVAMERSPEMLTTLLAIAKAGAAFLPLDPDAPLARLRAILEDSKALALVVQSAWHARFAGLHATVLAEEPAQSWAEMPNPYQGPHAGDLAYVLFTSGSTGRPKGVMIEHAALARRLAWISETYGVQPSDRSGHFTQYTFDPALIELFLPLINGASVALPPPGRLSPTALGPFALRHGVSIAALVPSTLRGLLDSIPESSGLRLRVACCGGEVLPVDLAERFVRQTGARLFNVYGPTEAAIFVSAWECRAPPREAALPVGRALSDSCIYVLDERLQMLPFGVVGEIFIGGRVLARGYVNRPDLDEGCFFADPFLAGGRMYRTGDRGWLDVEGILHFVGRNDHQIKLRGYRIELGEIEATLLTLEGVQQAAVSLIEISGKKVIHAWVSGLPSIALAALRSQLASRLPDYMVPQGITLLPALPLGATGKIDHASLPEPGIAMVQTPSRPPGNPMERALLALWQAVLKRDDLTIADNFFDVGGDSLAAIDILAGMETLIGRPVPLFSLIENPSIEQLARFLIAPSRVMEQEGAMLHLHGGKLPLYFAASGQGDLIRLRNLAAVLGDVCDFYMLQPPLDSVFSSIPELAAHYATKIVENGRPGVVAGFSVGGIAALETARCLAEQGFPVEKLILVDAIYPGRLMRSAIFWRAMGWLARNFKAYDLSLNGRHLGALFNDAGLLAQIDAMAKYRAEPCEQSVCLIKSSGMARWQRWAFKPWRDLFGVGLREIEVRGMHGSIFEQDNVEALAAVIRKAMGQQ